MRGASRASLAEATDRLTGMLAGGADAGQLGDGLFSVAELLDRESGLRRVLSDPSRPAAAKAGLAGTLLSGKVAAAALAPLLARRHIVAAFTSPARRAVATAALAGLDNTKVDPDLWEWDYGGYEGLTTAQIREERPGWYLWRDGVIPGDAEHPGETVDQVGQRVDRVLRRLVPLLDSGDVALVAHGHVLRVLTARYLGLEPSAGRLFRLDTGTISTLDTEHGEPVMVSWNVTSST